MSGTEGEDISTINTSAGGTEGSGRSSPAPPVSLPSLPRHVLPSLPLNNPSSSQDSAVRKGEAIAAGNLASSSSSHSLKTPHSAPSAVRDRSIFDDFTVAAAEELPVLRIGDIIALYTESNNDNTVGYISADGFVDTKIGIVTRGASEVPHNVRDSLFIVHTLNQYSASRQYMKAMEENTIDDEDENAGEYCTGTNPGTSEGNPSLSTPINEDAAKFRQNRLKILESKMEREKTNNEIEAERSLGREVTYGQGIQLLHLKSKKFLTVARESAEMQKDCMKLTLDIDGSSASYFHITPYFRFKKEGEKIRIGDHIRLCNRKFNQYIHASDKMYFEDAQERLEANMSSASKKDTCWSILLYSPFIQKEDDSQTFEVGDFIRIYHKEMEGYLTTYGNNSTSDFDILQDLMGYKKLRRVDSGITKEQMRRLGINDKTSESTRVKIVSSLSQNVQELTSTIWEIERKDRKKGGKLVWNEECRLKNVLTGKYLAIIPSTSNNEDFDDGEDIDSDDDLTDENVPFEDSEDDIDDYQWNESSSNEILKRKFSTASSSSALSRLSSGKILKKEMRSPAETWNILKQRIRASYRQGVQPFNMKQPTNLSLPLSSIKSIVNDDDDSSVMAEKYEVVITDSTNEETLFTIVSPNHLLGEISHDSFIRLYHKGTKCWVHASRGSITTETRIHGLKRSSSSSSLGSTSTKDLEYTKHIDVHALPNLHEEDVFSVSIISKEEINNLIYVQSILPLMLNTIGKIYKSKDLNATDFHNLIRILSTLIVFSSKSAEDDPLKRDGIPYKERQKLLRELKITDFTIQTMKLLLEKKHVTLETLSSPENKKYMKIFRLSYRLIQQACKQNSANGLHLYKYFDFIHSHSNFSLGAEEALLQLLNNNEELLKSIEYDQIKRFVDNLSTITLKTKYLQFLSAICTYHHKPVVKNQDTIATLLFGNNEKGGKYANKFSRLIIPTVDNGSVYINFGDHREEIGQVTRKATLSSNYAQVIDYLTSGIYMLSRLCFGRNYKSIHIVTEFFSYDLLLNCIKNDSLPSKLRASFCKLLLHAYLDVNPYVRKNVILVTRKWHEVESSLEQKREKSFQDLKQFLKLYFQRNSRLDLYQKSKNYFLLQLIKLCRHLFEFNLFIHVQDISSILTPLHNILDGNTDVFNGKPMSDATRFKETESNIMVTKIKQEICTIISLILDIRTNRRLSKFLIFFKERYQSNMSQNIKFSPETLASVAQEDGIIGDLFKDFRLFDSNVFDLMDDTLLDLIRYEDFELSTTALQLLFRLNSQKEELVNVLNKVEILVSESMIISYDKLYKLGNQLTQLLRARIDDQDAEKILKIIENIILDIKKNGQRSQRLCRNLNIHQTVLHALTSSTYLTPHLKRVHNQVFCALLLLLEMFVKKNPDNQAILFSHFPTLLGFISTYRIDTTPLLVEIVRNNRNLCSIVEEKYIRQFVDIIVESGLRARYLNFLRAIVVVEGKPLIRNQTLVTRALMDRKNDVILLYTDEDGLSERNKLIAENDHILNPDGRLNYHINLLNLLTDCTDGTNHLTEVKLQSVLSIEQSMDILLNPFTIKIFRDPLVKFLDEVYINTEKQSYKVLDCEKLWHLFVKFRNDIAIYLDEDVKIKEQIIPSRTPQKNRSHQAEYQTPMKINTNNKDMIDVSEDTSQQDNQQELAEGHIVDSHYIFKLIVPFLRHYFQRHFAYETITPEKKDIIFDLIRILSMLHFKTANPLQKAAVKQCLQALHSQTIIPGDMNNFLSSFFDSISETPVKINVYDNQIKLETGDETICKNYALYVKIFCSKLQLISDFASVAKGFAKSDIARKTLIEIVSKIDKHQEHNIPLYTTLQSLKTLHLLAEQDAFQEELAINGGMQLVMQLCCSKNEEVVQSALQLGILLLAEGNDAAQNVLYNLFESGSDEFFSAIKQRIRYSATEIKERKNHNKQIIQKLQTIADLKKRNINMSTIEEEMVIENFPETGHIKLLLRFLQLMCEGHNHKLQTYLGSQENTKTVPVNLVRECLTYTLKLQRFIDQSNVDIAMQCFDSLTEFIQGPCVDNQQTLGNSKLLFMANELLSDQYDEMLRYLDSLELKQKVIITLISLMEGSQTQDICDLMRSTLNLDLLSQNLDNCYKLITSPPDVIYQDIEERLKSEMEDPNLYFWKSGDDDEDDKNDDDIATKIEKVKKKTKRLGIYYYMLLNILADSEKLLPKDQQKASKLLNVYDNHPQRTKMLEFFKNATGTIEIIRDNRIERVYYKIPKICSFLSNKTKDKFEHDCPRNSAQEKVKTLYKRTRKFRVEMHHYASRDSAKSAFIWPFIQKRWDTLKFFGFALSIVINIFLMFTFKKAYFTSYGDIPIPGNGESIENVPLTGIFKERWQFYVMTVLGCIQIVTTAMLFLTYLYFYTLLKVKLQFNISMKEQWEDLPKKLGYKFYGLFLWGLVKDSYFWFILTYLIVSFLGVFISPAFYCLHLFEVIVRFHTLANVLRSITMNIRTLSVTALLMVVVIYFFSSIIFAWFFDTYVIEDEDTGEITILCSNIMQCFFSVLNYGLRTEGFWEDLMPVRVGWWKFFVDMSFYFICIITLINIVFGIILESFASLRKEKDEHESLKKNKCFICDIEKARFDMKANEGIRFDRHTKEEHYIWNYVFFLIYLYKKDHTEYTGTEQYIYDMSEKEDLSFFPVLRSLVLEEVEHKENHDRQQKYSALAKQSQGQY